jgi:HEAT repeat protein
MPMSAGEDPAKLLQDLGSEDDTVRGAAADRLVELARRDEAVVRQLAAALRSENRQVRFYSASVLGRAGGPRCQAAVPALARVFEDSKEEAAVRGIAANSLGLLGNAAVPVLVRQLGNKKDAFARLEAASALCATGVKEGGAGAIPALIDALGDEDSDVRCSAVDALERLRGAASQALEAALRRDDPYVRVYGAEALIRADSEKIPVAIPTLVEGLRHPDRKVRAQAAWAMTRVGKHAKSALPVLIGCLKDEEERVRLSAAHTISLLGPDAKPALPALTDALADEHEYVRSYAAMALADLGPEAKSAVPALVKRLKDESDDVRNLAVGALGAIGPAAKEALPSLLDALADGSAHKSLVTSAIKRIRGE